MIGDTEYAQTCLQHAKTLLDFADNYRGDPNGMACGDLSERTHDNQESIPTPSLLEDFMSPGVDTMMSSSGPQPGLPRYVDLRNRQKIYIQCM